MKKTLVMISALALALLVLAGCGGGASSSASTAPSSAAPTSAPTSASAADSSASDTSDALPAHNGLDPAGAAASLAEKAGMAETIKVMEIDLKAGGVNVDNIVAFEGLESKTSSQDAGIVIVIIAKEGKGAEVASEMESFKQFRMGNGDYEEFAEARERTENARIETFGDVVVYAVSANGDWDTLDAAISAEFT